MDLSQKALIVNSLLKKEFVAVSTPLTHSNAFNLLVAVVLSAQTLDNTVNKVTPRLFLRYPTPLDLANANVEDVMSLIKIVNYYKTKSKNIILLAKSLVENFNSQVPSTIKDLITLPGVGRKTANVVINEWFTKADKSKLPEGFVVDTHVKRVAYRIGLTNNSDPLKVEQDIIKILPQKEWDDFALRLIFHGRKTCKSQNPSCISCPLKDVCLKKGVNHNSV